MADWLHERLTSPEQLRAEEQQRLGNPAYVQVDPGNAYTGPLNADTFYSYRSELEKIPGITWDEILQYRAMMDADPQNYATILNLAGDTVSRRVGASREDEQARKIEERRTSALSDIGGLETQGKGLYEGEINRLGGFLSNPATMYSDAELAARLTDFEGAIGGQLDQARAGAAKTTSQAGLRASGKVNTGLQGMEQQGAYLSAKNRGGLLGDIESAKRGLEEGYLNFKGGIAQARDTANAGGIADLSGLRSLSGTTVRPDFSVPQMTGYDIQGLGYGKESMDWGQAFQLMSMLMQAGQNTQGQTMQFLGGLKGGK